MVRLPQSNGCPVRSLPIDELSIMGDTQPRAEINEDLVAEYVEAIRVGAKFPPIVLFFDGATYWIADGFHRWWAARRLERERIDCEVHKGTLEDARWYSYAANQTHGARRTNPDKRKAVLAALRHPKGAKASDKQIAEHVGVHFNTVAKYRAELTTDGTITKCDSRTGRDGRTIDTRNIGRTKYPKGFAAELKRIPELPGGYPGRWHAYCDYKSECELGGKPETVEGLRAFVTKGVDRIRDFQAKRAEKGNTPTCPRCGSHEVDEDGDCLKCKEPAVAPAPADDDHQLHVVGGDDDHDDHGDDQHDDDGLDVFEPLIRVIGEIYRNHPEDREMLPTALRKFANTVKKWMEMEAAQ